MNFSNFFGTEWKELKKFGQLSDIERSIVFYAENKASINHFKLLIFELTEKMNLQICYITSVKNDPILNSKNQNIKSFYIGDGVARTKFFLTLKAKILLMDMPDLETFHVKRSKSFPVHYIYIFHSMFSVHSYLREGAVDNYDTIFCVGKHHVDEIRAIEKIYKLKQKKLVPYGFGRLDTLLEGKKNFQKTDLSKKVILITPSYGENNLLNTCGIQLINILLKSNFKVVLRPHFKILRDYSELLVSIKEKFGKHPNFILEEGIIPDNLFYNSLCMISDWSGISFEYAFTFERPVIFIDVPKKVLNLNSDIISLEPIEISLRQDIGHVISPNKLEEVVHILNTMEQNGYITNQKIRDVRLQTVYNIGESAKIGVEYIQQILDKIKSN
jgi:YidC/Oxa1 family membrane protein insertase